MLFNHVPVREYKVYHEEAKGRIANLKSPCGN